MQLEFNRYRIHPTNTQISLFSTRMQRFSLLLCVPVQQILNPKLNADPELDASILKKYTFSQLESLTNNGLNLTLNKTYLSYASLLIDAHFHIEKKVFFRNSFFLDNKILLFSRCFSVHLDLNEERYKTLLGITKLIISVKKNQLIAIYVIELNEKNFHYKSYQYLSKFQIIKYSVRKTNLTDENHCKNYALDPEYKCSSKWKCINNCKTFEYLRKNFKFLLNRTVIDKDDYDDYLFNNTYFTNEDDQNITNTCKSKFQENDCEDDFFSESYKKFFPISNDIIINLYFEIIENKDMLPNPYKYFLSILNIASILFGINMEKIMLTALALIKVIFNMKWYFWYKPLVFLICLLLCSYNIYVIFRDLIFQELMPNGYYHKDENSSLPDLAFCFQYDKKFIDTNHKVTGNYLDYLTTNLTFDKIFEKISYADKDGNIIEIQNFTSNDDIQFEYYYYLNMKCFQISLLVIYDERDFLFSDDPFQFKIWFNRIKQSEELIINFTCKKRGTKQFNQFSQFLFKSNNFRKRKFQIKLEQVETIYKDVKLYQYLKQPKSLIFGSQGKSMCVYFFLTLSIF